MLAGVHASGGVSPGIGGAAVMILLMERQALAGGAERAAVTAAGSPGGLESSAGCADVGRRPAFPSLRDHGAVQCGARDSLGYSLWLV